MAVAEGLDRISRDQEPISGILKQMQYRGICTVTVSQSNVSEMQIGFNGVLSAMFLKDLAAKTHRGLEGRVRKGKSAGGISYGYRMTGAFHEDGLFSIARDRFHGWPSRWTERGLCLGPTGPISRDISRHKNRPLNAAPVKISSKNTR